MKSFLGESLMKHKRNPICLNIQALLGNLIDTQTTSAPSKPECFQALFISSWGWSISLLWHNICSSQVIQSLKLSSKSSLSCHYYLKFSTKCHKVFLSPALLLYYYSKHFASSFTGVGIHIKNEDCQVWWHTLVILALERLRQVDRKFKANAGYLVSARLVWDTYKDLFLKKKIGTESCTQSEAEQCQGWK